MKPAWWVECVSRSKGDAMHAADVVPTTQRVIGSKLRTTTWMVNGSAWVALEAARSRQWLGTQGPDLSAGSGLELLGAPRGSAGTELWHCQGGGILTMLCATVLVQSLQGQVECALSMQGIGAT